MWMSPSAHRQRENYNGGTKASRGAGPNLLATHMALPDRVDGALVWQPTKLKAKSDSIERLNFVIGFGLGEWQVSQGYRWLDLAESGPPDGPRDRRWWPLQLHRLIAETMSLFVCSPAVSSRVPESLVPFCCPEVQVLSQAGLAQHPTLPWWGQRLLP